LIYNSSDSNKSVAVIDFGEDISVSAGNLTVKFPSSGASNSIIRVS
jgi:hypothetical protein